MGKMHWKGEHVLFNEQYPPVKCHLAIVVFPDDSKHLDELFLPVELAGLVYVCLELHPQ